MEPVNRQLAQYLRRQRKQLGMSQTRLAQLTGTLQPQIARLESGLANPSLALTHQVLRGVGAELMPIPAKLIPAVEHLIDAADGRTSLKRTRLVGNQPEDAEWNEHEL